MDNFFIALLVLFLGGVAAVFAFIFSQYRTNSATTNTDPQNKLTIYPPVFEGYNLKYHYSDINIAGHKHYDTTAAKIGQVIELIDEPDNQYDPNAVAVIFEGKKYGYVPRSTLLDMVHDFRKRSLPVSGTITTVEEDVLKMVMWYYDLPLYTRLIQRGVPFKTYKLVSNSNEDMQFNMSYCNVGDEVFADYECEKDKYSAYCQGDIGFFPKSANSVLKNEGQYMVFIHAIDGNENEKLIVTVALFEGEFN